MFKMLSIPGHIYMFDNAIFKWPKYSLRNSLFSCSCFYLFIFLKKQNKQNYYIAHKLLISTSCRSNSNFILTWMFVLLQEKFLSIFTDLFSPLFYVWKVKFCYQKLEKLTHSWKLHYFGLILANIYLSIRADSSVIWFIKDWNDLLRKPFT